MKKFLIMSFILVLVTSIAALTQLTVTLLSLSTLLSSVAAAAFDSDYTLKSISVIFRHGDRTPEGFYPTDPYRNYTFDPIGLGGLTKVGKKREHEIGTSLRNRYNELLGETFRSRDVSVVSTDYERTIMSLLLVLAGLYPPKNQQAWNDDLEWQPIPVYSVPTEVATFLRQHKCPTYDRELSRVMRSEEYKRDLSQFNELLGNLTIHTGLDMQDTGRIYHLFHTLSSELAMNLTLPEWTKSYYPKGEIIDAVMFQYRLQSYNKLLTKLNGGMFVQKILDDTVYSKKIQVPKVNLYSVHENNIAGVLKALNVWKDMIPEYSCAIVFELFEKDSKYFFRILYYKGIPAEFEVRVIPGCSEYCPLDEFLEIFKDILPGDILEACFGPPGDSLLIPKSVDPNVWIYDKLRQWFNV